MPNYKPQSPLVMNGEGIFPLTTYDQIIMPDGSRWDGKSSSAGGNSTGGATVTLNGLTTTNASFYAPISTGTSGQVLKSNGSGAPEWMSLAESAFDPLYSKYVLHDIFAFCRTATPIYEASTDGSIWTALTLDKRIFDQKDGTESYMFQNGYNAHRWTWDGTTFNYAAIRYLLVKYSYSENQPRSRLIMEAKPDSSWITIVDTEYSANSAWKTIPVNGYSTGPIRITIQKADFTAEGAIPLVALQCLSIRPGNQGQRIEYESPIDWDEDRNITGVSFSGSGAGLTSLNASNITSGTISAARLPEAYLPIAGGTMTGKLQVNDVIVGYNYGKNGNNVAAFVWDKPGGKWTGMGANTEQDTIYFGACDADGNWDTSYRQKWKFNGSLIVGGGDDNCNIVPWTNNYSTIGTESLKWWKVYATNIHGDKVYGAVWNDYAEYRDQLETIEPGYIAYSEDDGILRLTTERLQPFEGVVSDTFGFAIGETDKCKTPLAVSGRVLVYTNPDDELHAGDCVCAGPGGLAYRMTREEVIEFPDRIVGTVSEIPTYETWGTGNVAVNNRIWIKVR